MMSHTLNAPNAQLPPDAAKKRGDLLFAQGRYQEALDICIKITNVYPGLVDAWVDAARNCAKLARWQDVITYAQTALMRGGNELILYDALVNAHGRLGQWNDVRRYGLRALEMRDGRASGTPPVPFKSLAPMPPLPGPQTRTRNVIAFSLSGNDSRYCETAILNAQAQPRIYPHWVCRFYVDEEVPENVIARLRENGGQVLAVRPARWPVSLWSLLALDDPLVHRVLFRDANAVISPREAQAVGQWLASDKRFHMMRDGYAHTGLIMAGLWGAVGGSLPPLEKLMQHFTRAWPKSENFTDQDFLQPCIWPYARASLMQHDSVFGFMGAAAFPDGARPDHFYVGEADGGSFVAKTDLPDGSAVSWALYQVEKQDDGQSREERICFYPATVQQGTVTAHIPTRYVQMIGQGTACIRLAHARQTL